MSEGLVAESYVPCEHVILWARIVALCRGIRHLRNAVDELSKAGNSFPSLLRSIETSERLLKYARAALTKLPPCDGCRE